MGEAEISSRRRGGRAARRELRAAPIPEAARPVRPGLTGGRYHPLTEAEVGRIHAAALDVLEQIGFANPIPSCVELMTAAGARLTPEGRLVIPRALVEDTLAGAARNILLHAFDPGLDMELSGTRVHFALPAPRSTWSIRRPAPTANRPCGTSTTWRGWPTPWSISISSSVRSSPGT